MKNFKSIVLFTFAVVALGTSCKRKFDLPAKKTIADGPPITIDSIYGRYFKYYVCSSCISNGTPSKVYQFPNDICLTATVTADEKSGNIYKIAYIKDATGTLQVKLLNAGGLYVGDIIKINLKGIKLDDYAKMVQLDSVDIEKSVVKLSSGNVVAPKKSTFNDVLSQNPLFAGPTSFSVISTLQGAVVTLDSVEFDIGSKNQVYADATTKTSIDRTIVNSTGQSLTVRTSGYAYFASNLIPCGKMGKLTAVVSQYNSTIQLIIRDFNEVQIGGGNCPYISKNFDDNSLTSGGWSAYAVSGANYWTIGTVNGTYANASNYVGGTNFACDNWLISPPVNLSSSTNPVLKFMTAKNYSGPNLEVYVSSTYTSGAPSYSAGVPSSSEWTLLSPTLSSGSWAWVSSGNLSLNAFKSSNVRIAFRYTGTGSAGSTWEVDNVGIIEN